MSLNSSRRVFLKSSVAAVAPVFAASSTIAIMPGLLQAEVVEADLDQAPGTMADEEVLNPYGPDRVLRLWNVHTGERYEGPYWSRGRFVSAAMDQISYLLRDYRIDQTKPIDPLVVDFMHTVYAGLKTEEPIQVLSGYRSPKTNAALAKQSSNVAKNSFHMLGKAIDFRVPGQNAAKLRSLALRAHKGGVGYYRDRDFIHIDTGDFRSWE